MQVLNPPDPNGHLDALVAASEDAARLMRIMGHGARLRILCTLIQGELPSGEIARQIGIREPAASQQLALLRAERLVATRREGQKVLYSVANPVVERILRELQATFCPAP